VAAVGHGSAGLVKARQKDGRSIIDGRRVSCFANSEEAAVIPFLLEDRLKELGGGFEHAFDWQPFAVVNGSLITGQNPHSSELVARHVLSSLARAG
jgi:putative intracellular protease/amidase